MSNITIKLNGKKTKIQTGSTINDLLEVVKIKSKMFVVELNKEIIYKPDYDTCRFKEGDSIEIVGFFGGG